MNEQIQHPFTPEEKEIMDLLIKAHNLFVLLPDPHPLERQEWCFYFHGLQGLLEHRALKHLYPKYFR